jgi:hypothetical protein
MLWGLVKQNRQAAQRIATDIDLHAKPAPWETPRDALVRSGDSETWFLGLKQYLLNLCDFARLVTSAIARWHCLSHSSENPLFCFGADFMNV